MTTNERNLIEAMAVFAAAVSALGVFMTVYDAVQPGPPEQKICRDAESLQRVPCRYLSDGNTISYDYSQAAVRPSIESPHPAGAAPVSTAADQTLVDLARADISQRR